MLTQRFSGEGGKVKAYDDSRAKNMPGVKADSIAITLIGQTLGPVSNQIPSILFNSFFSAVLSTLLSLLGGGGTSNLGGAESDSHCQRSLR